MHGIQACTRTNAPTGLLPAARVGRTVSIVQIRGTHSSTHRAILSNRSCDQDVHKPRLVLPHTLDTKSVGTNDGADAKRRSWLRASLCWRSHKPAGVLWGASQWTVQALWHHQHLRAPHTRLLGLVIVGCNNWWNTVGGTHSHLQNHKSHHIPCWGLGPSSTPTPTLYAVSDTTPCRE